MKVRYKTVNVTDSINNVTGWINCLVTDTVLIGPAYCDKAGVPCPEFRITLIEWDRSVNAVEIGGHLQLTQPPLFTRARNVPPTLLTEAENPEGWSEWETVRA